MAHPFAKLFLGALRKSTQEENLVLKKAKEILERGYAKDEVVAVLTKLKIGLLDDTEEMIVTEAIEAIVEED